MAGTLGPGANQGRRVGPSNARKGEVIRTARRLLQEEGPRGLTMRRLARRLGIKAPSLYKHLPGRPVIEAELREAAWVELALLLRTAASGPGPGGASRLLGAYRRAARAEPHLYRLAMTGLSGPAPTSDAVARVAGAFRLVAEDPVQSGALWGLAHGLAMLELDGRLPAGAGTDLAWERAASSFEGISGPH